MSRWIDAEELMRLLQNYRPFVESGLFNALQTQANQLLDCFEYEIEVDGNVYCFGITDAMYEDTVYIETCKGCPRLLANNEDKIAEWIAIQRKESE